MASPALAERRMNAETAARRTLNPHTRGRGIHMQQDPPPEPAPPLQLPAPAIYAAGDEDEEDAHAERVRFAQSVILQDVKGFYAVLGRSQHQHFRGA